MVLRKQPEITCFYFPVQSGTAIPNTTTVEVSRQSQKDIYHIGDEFLKEVFQKLLRGQQWSLVQLLLPQVIIIVHRLRKQTGRRLRDGRKKINTFSVDVHFLWATLTHMSAQSMSTAAWVTPLLFLFKALTVFKPNFSLNLQNTERESFIWQTGSLHPIKNTKT